MRIVILGGDGYLGWPTALHFSARGDEVVVVDNFSKRRWELEDGIEPLIPVPTLHRRIIKWKEKTGADIQLQVGDICNHRFLYKVLEKYRPDAIIHYGEQPSAPYSMQSRENAVYTQTNNVIGTLNLLFAMRRYCPEAHLVKLGTMGEYGTPNIDIEEGWLTVTHNGRSDTVLYPKRPGSFYHLSKVHDSNNIEFACRIWELAATDLNQGVVYGLGTDHSAIDSELRASFHYDHVFGTVLNRFLVQAAIGMPLTIYGLGGQTRGFLNITDTIQCVALAVDSPAKPKEFRVMNQFTEQFSVAMLAEKVQAAGCRAGLEVKLNHIENPRIEMESHYYNAKHSKLADLGLKPHLLTDETLDSMLSVALRYRDNVKSDTIMPTVTWAQKK
jgi:UDP-sulfoquinovose synthase